MRFLVNEDAAADVHQAANCGVTPLYISCQEGHLAIVRFLRSEDVAADVNQADDDSATPLCVSCAKGHLDVLQLLLSDEVGADVNRAMDGGFTVWVWTATRRSLASLTHSARPSNSNRIDFKWRTFARYYFERDLLIYAMFVLTFTAASMMMLLAARDDAAETANHATAFVLLAVSFIFWLWFFSLD